MTLEPLAQRLWYGPARRSWWLWPPEALYRIVIAVRRFAYSSGLLRTVRVEVPVIVVGNLTVGGTGKTPVVSWLARQLATRGLKVGIVLRGYRGSHAGPALRVRADTDATLAGDEAVMHAAGGADIVFVAHDRVAAARAAADSGAQVVLSDDGLQHLRLARDCEVVVIDRARGFGNGHCLPAGPLREPAARIDRADAVVVVDRAPGERDADPAMVAPSPITCRVEFELGPAVNLVTGERRPLAAFAGERVRAVAGVGDPEAFFAALERAGLRVERCPLPDHATVDEIARALAGVGTVLMTEKDAVKCRGLADARDWFVMLGLAFAAGDDERLLEKVLERVRQPRQPGVSRG